VGAIFTALSRGSSSPADQERIFLTRNSSALHLAATCCISSELGVIRPERPMMSAPSTRAFARIPGRHHHAHVDDLEVVALETQ